jgi:serine/threonine-protein kinase
MAAHSSPSIPPESDETTLESERRVGKVLAGKYRLDSLLGVGGMAAVYAATHLNNSKRFALKVLHPIVAIQADVKKRFLREGYIANKVEHPGAVSVLDDGTDEDGTVFLVMELLEGVSLRGKADRDGRLPPRELLRIVIDLLDVLAASHTAGIIHRDLKADNVFITNANEVKVLDFGVARINDAPEGKTRTGVVMGTPEYMPPEQARGRSELVDGRSDLWAVGAMMYKLLTGHYPHEAETTNEVLLLAMTEPAPKLKIADAHPLLVALVDKALAFERDDRFPDAKAMQAAAREALAEIAKADTAPTQVGVPSPIASTPGDVASAKTLEARVPSGNLWVHEKATPPSLATPAAKKPSKLRRVLIGLLAVGMIAGAVWGMIAIRKLRARVAGDADAATLDPSALAAVTVPLSDDAGDDDAGDDEDELDDDNPYTDVDASMIAPKPTTSVAIKPVPTIKKTIPKTTTKKKRRR